jgi:hypothetical protein
MNKNLIVLTTLIFCLITTMACGLPFINNEGTEEGTQVLVPGYAIYNNGIIEIALPKSYALQDFREDIPGLMFTLNLMANLPDGAPLRNFLENLLSNVVFYAEDFSYDLNSPRRVIVIDNKSMANVPLGMLNSSLELLIGSDAEELKGERIKLGNHDVLKFTLQQKNNGVVVFALKEQSRMWLIVFITSVDQFEAMQSDFEYSVSMFKVLSLPPEN